MQTRAAVSSWPRRPGFGIALAATDAAPDVPLAYVALFCSGAAGFTFLTLTSTTVQLHTSAAYRGRIMPCSSSSTGTTLIGSVLTGWITEVEGARAALLVGALACGVPAVLGSDVQTHPHPDRAVTDLAADPRPADPGDAGRRSAEDT